MACQIFAIKFSKNPRRVYLKNKSTGNKFVIVPCLLRRVMSQLCKQVNLHCLGIHNSNSGHIDYVINTISTL